MKTISKSEVASVLSSIPKSAIFSVDFIKKSGDARSINGRRGVMSGLTPNARPKAANPKEIITIWEMSKKQYRAFDVNRVTEIRANGEVFKVEEN